MNATVTKASESVAMTAGVDRLIELAISSDADVEKLGKLMDLKERHDANEARKAYYEALRRVEQEAPRIKKDAKNDQTSSHYARLEAINASLVPIYTKEGFSLSFGEDPAIKDRHVRISCDIYHSSGHIEHKAVELPLDDVGIKGTVNKTGVHATGSTISYGRRYLTLMIFNISTGDDDDGQEAGRSHLEMVIRHNEALRENNNLDSVAAIKNALALGDYAKAVEAYYEISDEDKFDLRLSWTKGGMFSPKETAQMKSNEWGAARSAHYGGGTVDDLLQAVAAATTTDALDLVRSQNDERAAPDVLKAKVTQAIKDRAATLAP